VLEQAQREVWPAENPQAINDQRVVFMEHNFFDTNPVEGADVYWLRYILYVCPVGRRPLSSSCVTLLLTAQARLVG
jgi:hypothetical protein